MPAYFSHHKCATMYVNGILARLCRENGLRFRSFDDASQFGGDLPGYLSRHPVDFLSFINAEWEHVRRLDDVVGFHVIRDPRDILVSAYFSHLRTHATDAWPELVRHRERLRSASKEEGLYLQIDFIADVFDALRTWDYGSDAILELKFEELTDRPYSTFLQIFEHLEMCADDPLGLRGELIYACRGLWNQIVARVGGSRLLALPRRRIPGERILAVVHRNRFGRKTGGRAPGEEDRRSHYRKGVPGDWRNHLDPGHVTRLHERFPGILEATGYASADEKGTAAGGSSS